MSTSQSYNVLVVDDDYAIRDMLTMFLEEEGFNAVCATIGREAIDLLRSAADQPRVVLLDLNMPVMTGWEFRQEQQHDPAIANVPVAVISADRSIVQQPTIDAEEYFPKPLDLDRLLAFIQQCCD
jgi:CheY-like chemotaxis protein